MVIREYCVSTLHGKQHEVESICKADKTGEAEWRVKYFSNGLGLPHKTKWWWPNGLKVIFGKFKLLVFTGGIIKMLQAFKLLPWSQANRNVITAGSVLGNKYRNKFIQTN